MHLILIDYIWYRLSINLIVICLRLSKNRYSFTGINLKKWRILCRQGFINIYLCFFYCIPIAQYQILHCCNNHNCYREMTILWWRCGGCGPSRSSPPWRKKYLRIPGKLFSQFYGSGYKLDPYSPTWWIRRKDSADWQKIPSPRS